MEASIQRYVVRQRIFRVAPEILVHPWLNEIPYSSRIRELEKRALTDCNRESVANFPHWMSNVLLTRSNSGPVWTLIESSRQIDIFSCDLLCNLSWCSPHTTSTDVVASFFSLSQSQLQLEGHQIIGKRQAHGLLREPIGEKVSSSNPYDQLISERTV